MDQGSLLMGKVFCLWTLSSFLVLKLYLAMASKKWILTYISERFFNTIAQVVIQSVPPPRQKCILITFSICTLIYCETSIFGAVEMGCWSAGL